MTTTTVRRIDQIECGTITTVVNVRRAEEITGVFAGITGEGEDRRAKFVTFRSDGGFFEWQVYRVNGRWCYGSGAERCTFEFGESIGK